MRATGRHRRETRIFNRSRAFLDGHSPSWIALPFRSTRKPPKHSMRTGTGPAVFSGSECCCGVPGRAGGQELLVCVQCEVSALSTLGALGKHQLSARLAELIA